ncbi:MAG TPA: PaaX family transcriptional regulator C-terminal domain-containing protein [Longimicrobiales bacterium]
MAAARPQDLIWTLYGEFLLHDTAPVWVGSLIALLEPLGVSEGHARTLLSRMTAKGWLAVRRQGRRAYYSLAERGRRLLEEGEARIYHPARASEWDGEWTLLAYSIPEELRPLRDRLRVRLSWLGFGSLGNGLWVSPHEVRDRVREIGDELGVTGHLQLFRGAHAGFTSAESLVRQCWDLAAINVRYESFIRRHLRDYRKLAGKSRSALSSREAYVRRFELVHEYREFLLLDPFLPRPLQPGDWAGECAQALFEAYRALLSESADEYLSSVVQRHPATGRSAVH